MSRTANDNLRHAVSIRRHPATRTERAGIPGGKGKQHDFQFVVPSVFWRSAYLSRLLFGCVFVAHFVVLFVVLGL